MGISRIISGGPYFACPAAFRSVIMDQFAFPIMHIKIIKNNMLYTHFRSLAQEYHELA